MLHVECDVMTVKRVEGRIFSVNSFPIFSGKQRHAIIFFCSLCSLPLLFFRYTHAGIVTFPVYLPYVSAQRCMIEIIFMPDIYENYQTCRPNSRLGTWTRNCMHLFYYCTQKDQQKWSTVLSFGINTTNVSDFSRMSHIRVSDYCLTPTQFFSYRYIMARTSFWWDDDEVCFVLDQHAELDIYSASSLKQQSAGRSTRTHYSDSEPTSLCSYFWVLYA